MGRKRWQNRIKSLSRGDTLAIWACACPPTSRLAALAETSTRPAKLRNRSLLMTTKEEPHAKPLLRLALFASVMVAKRQLAFLLLGVPPSSLVSTGRLVLPRFLSIFPPISHTCLLAKGRQFCYSWWQLGFIPRKLYKSRHKGEIVLRGNAKDMVSKA